MWSARQRADHIEARGATINERDALLDGHRPGGKAIVADRDSDIAFKFLDRYPASQAAAELAGAG